MSPKGTAMSAAEIASARPASGAPTPPKRYTVYAIHGIVTSQNAAPNTKPGRNARRHVRPERAASRGISATGRSGRIEKFGKHRASRTPEARDKRRRENCLEGKRNGMRRPRRAARTERGRGRGDIHLRRNRAPASKEALARLRAPSGARCSGPKQTLHPLFGANSSA